MLFRSTGDGVVRRFAISSVSAAWACVWVVTVCPAPARAGDVSAQLKELQKIVRRLEQDNQDLRDRLAVIEQQLADRSKPVMPAKGQPNADQGKAAWRQLQTGMTGDEVRSLLGEPERVSVGSTLVFWYYPIPRGRVREPQVVFNKDGMTVYSWEEQ